SKFQKNIKLIFEITVVIEIVNTYFCTLLKFI
ncbi:MAG: hypothetical protein ACI9FW_002190, partial [Flavobacterium sp.]